MNEALARSSRLARFLASAYMYWRLYVVRPMLQLDTWARAAPTPLRSDTARPSVLPTRPIATVSLGAGTPFARWLRQARTCGSSRGLDGVPPMQAGRPRPVPRFDELRRLVRCGRCMCVGYGRCASVRPTRRASCANTQSLALLGNEETCPAAARDDAARRLRAPRIEQHLQLAGRVSRTKASALGPPPALPPPSAPRRSPSPAAQPSSVSVPAADAE